MNRKPERKTKVFSCSLSKKDLSKFITHQVDSLFNDGVSIRPKLDLYISSSLERMEYCMFRASLKGFYSDDGPCYNHLHTDQHAIFLYYLSNSVFQMGGPKVLCDKLYALNKALHGVDIFYEVKMLDIFALVHPVGTVLGRASYGDYFCAYQNVSVGSDLDGNNPKIGRGVVMYGGSRIIGRSQIGDNCLISIGTTILDRHIGSDCVAFGTYPNIEAKKTHHNVISEIFNPIK